MDSKELDILNRPYALSYDLFSFYASSVGKVLNYSKEHVLLMDWQDSIEACDKQARNLRDRLTLKDMAAFRQEVKTLLECNAPHD